MLSETLTLEPVSILETIFPITENVPLCPIDFDFTDIKTLYKFLNSVFVLLLIPIAAFLF